MKTALLQLNCSDDPSSNLRTTLGMIADAAGQGAGFVLTPEVTNCVSASRTHQMDVLQHEDQDSSLAALAASAADHSVWLLIGSLALKGGSDGRFVNRSFLIRPDGQPVAWYDKIHMFDVQISQTESYRESDGYQPGSAAVTVATGFGTLGLSICYDIRFPYLYRRLADAGATILTVPSAFSPVTGAAHWEPLLRARAIECGAWVLAPAQCGTHAATRGKQRTTYGHSLVVDPWGRVVADGGTEPGIITVDLDPAEVDAARRRIPSLTHTRDVLGPA